MNSEPMAYMVFGVTFSQIFNAVSNEKTEMSDAFPHFSVNLYFMSGQCSFFPFAGS